MNFAAFGRTQMLYDSIIACVACGHKAVLVGTSPAAPEYTRNERDFERLARELGCPFFCDPAINKPEYVQMSRDSGAEVAISVNWQRMIGPAMLDQFKHGIINAHAGDLPRYRGNAVPNWAILAGEDKVELTLHQMTTDLDAGPILLQRPFLLTSETYIGDVYRFMEKNVPEVFCEVLDGFEKGVIKPCPQPTDPAISLRCFPRRPEDGLINWRQPAEQIARLVRASAEPFAGAYTFRNGEKLVIWRARPGKLPYPWLGVPGQIAEIRKEKSKVVVLTGDGVLLIEEVESASFGRSPAHDQITSHRTRLGLDIVGKMEQLEEKIAILESRIT